jgi:hypothetical protein
MAEYQTPQTPKDLGPSATGALGAAYDTALQSHASELLRYSLARHLMNAALAGEMDPDRLRERASAFVANWGKPTPMAASLMP